MAGTDVLPSVVPTGDAAVHEVAEFSDAGHPSRRKKEGSPRTMARRKRKRDWARANRARKKTGDAGT